MKQLMSCFKILSTLSLILFCEEEERRGEGGGRRTGGRGREGRQHYCVFAELFGEGGVIYLWTSVFLTFSATSSSATLAVESTLTL